MQAHPDFQLFVTRRLLPSGNKEISGSAGLLDKLWNKILLETLSVTELKELIVLK